MNYKAMIQDLCSLEGKKVDVSIGNIKEVVKCLAVLEAAYRIRDGKGESSEVFAVLEKLVKARMKKGAWVK